MPSAIFPFTVRDRLGPLGTKSEGSGTSGSLQAVSFLYNGLINNTRGEDCFTNNKEHGGISVMKKRQILLRRRLSSRAAASFF